MQPQYLTFGLTYGLLLFSPNASALPASARLFQQNYGYKVSCSLCHSSGGGSATNKYGKAFLRAGANAGAFKKIENADSDEDGLPNKAEVLAKSNPGDKQSTPNNVGDWLANANSVALPKKELEKLFPGFDKFSAIEGSLNAQQIAFLKSKLGSEPNDDDKVPTFYFAEKDGKRQAVGQLLSTQVSEGKGLTAGVAVSTSGKVLKVEVIGGASAKELAQNEAFLNSYVERSAGTLPAKPKSDVAQLLHSSVERSLYLIQAVFGGGK